MHPTQTLADLATLQSRFGRVTNLTVGLCGDLTFGRTVHSLIETLCRFGNVNFVLISPDELKTPQYVLDRINATESCSYTEVKDLVSVIGDLDVLYMTRVQKERFFNEDDYLRLRDTYILDEAKMRTPRRTWPCCTRCRAQRNRRGSRRRSACSLLRTGQERYAHAHGIGKLGGR